uniref:Uncharacterized protein n=1 Tax=Anguilla anguilla TaxID=7936 RepID=A0A0E9SAL1_ANGAN
MLYYMQSISHLHEKAIWIFNGILKAMKPPGSVQSVKQVSCTAAQHSPY